MPCIRWTDVFLQAVKLYHHYYLKKSREFINLFSGAPYEKIQKEIVLCRLHWSHEKEIRYKWPLVIEEVEEVRFCILMYGRIERRRRMTGVWKSCACRIGILLEWRGDWVEITSMVSFSDIYIFYVLGVQVEVVEVVEEAAVVEAEEVAVGPLGVGEVEVVVVEEVLVEECPSVEEGVV